MACRKEARVSIPGKDASAAGGSLSSRLLFRLMTPPRTLWSALRKPARSLPFDTCKTTCGLLLLIDPELNRCAGSRCLPHFLPLLARISSECFSVFFCCLLLTQRNVKKEKHAD